MSYEVAVAGERELESCREAWDDLAARTRFPCIFNTWEWVDTWRRHVGQGPPLILLVRRQGQLRGVLPLASRWAFLGGYWETGQVLEFCGSSELYPDHLDLICAPEDEEGCVASVSHFLRREYQRWDVLQLDRVLPDGALARSLGGKGSDGAFLRAETRRTGIAPFLAIEGSFDEYFGAFDKKRRYNLASRRRKLREQGIRYVPCEAGAEGEALDGLFELHRLRAARKGLKSSFDRPVVRAFHHALVEAMRPRGWVTLRFLRSDREVIAVSYNFTYAGRVFSFQKGIDPRWEKFGPGTVLYCELLQEAFAAGATEYNFLHGDERYKSEWTARSRPLISLSVFRGSALGRVSRALFSAKQRIRSATAPVRGRAGASSPAHQ